jgi:hypothetical protein
MSISRKMIATLIACGVAASGLATGCANEVTTADSEPNNIGQSSDQIFGLKCAWASAAYNAACGSTQCYAAKCVGNLAPAGSEDFCSRLKENFACVEAIKNLWSTCSRAGVKAKGWCISEPAGGLDWGIN